MDKFSLLNEISQLAGKNAITKEELLTAYEKGQGQVEVSGQQTLTPIRFDLATILYYLGGAIVFLGVSIFIGKNWDTLNPLSRLLVTLGTGVVAYSMAVLFTANERLEKISQAFYLISALILPVGIYTLFDNAGVNAISYKFQAINALLLAAIFYTSYFIFKKNVLLLFAVIFSTWLYFDLTLWFYDVQLHSKPENFMNYSLLLAGGIYILAGYFLSSGTARIMAGFLYSFGIIGVLSAGICLTGWMPDQNHIWETIFPLMTFGSFILSIKLESKSILVFGAIFLIGYILKMADEYYTGGPLAPLLLVVIGLLLIAIGYGTYYLNNKYLSRRN